MEFNRPRTRLRDNEELIRRYREWKEGEAGNGGERGSNSSKFRIFETSRDNVRRGLTKDNSKKVGENMKGALRITDNLASKDNKKNVKSDLVGCELKKIEKNRRGVRRKSDKFIESCGDPRKKCKSRERIRKNINPNEDELDIDVEEEDNLAQPVVDLRRGKSILQGLK